MSFALTAKVSGRANDCPPTNTSKSVAMPLFTASEKVKVIVLLLFNWIFGI